MRCAIWYHYLQNIKNVKRSYGGVLLLLFLQPKVTLLCGCFSHFLSSANDSKSHKTFHFQITILLVNLLLLTRLSLLCFVNFVNILQVLEPRFNADTLANLLSIPLNKSLIRKHVSSQFSTLLGDACQRQKDMTQRTSDFVPLNGSDKHKVLYCFM